MIEAQLHESELPPLDTVPQIDPDRQRLVAGNAWRQP